MASAPYGPRQRTRKDPAPMDNSLLISLSQQLSAYQSMDVIANNIANVSTPGYRREEPTFDEYVAHVRPSETQKGMQALSFVQQTGTVRNMAQGALLLFCVFFVLVFCGFVF